MPPSVDNEVVEIRERLTRIETTLEFIQGQMKCFKPVGTGNVVIPVTVVVAGIELLKVVLERFS